VFKVHAVVVCSSCDFFRKSLRFAVGKEAEENLINLPEDNPEMVRRLIAYLYLGDYDPNDGMDLSKFATIAQHESTSAANSTYHYRRGAFGVSVTDPCACLAPNTKHTQQPVADADAAVSKGAHKLYEKTAYAVEVADPLTIHASMYALGDKYQVEGLSQLAKEKFESCLHHHVHSEDFISAVQMAYSTTPDSNRGLRDSVMDAFRIHFKTDVASIPGAEAKLDSIDELSFLLIKSWPKKVEPLKVESKSSSSSITTSPWGSLPPAPPGLFGVRPPLPPSHNESPQAPASTPSLFGGMRSPPPSTSSTHAFRPLFGAAGNSRS
jgi:hypothetical protein